MVWASRLLTGITTLCICFSISYALFVYTPLKHIIPGYPGEDAITRQAEVAMRIDSLELMIRRWELYSENLRSVVSGGKSVGIESIISEVNASRSNSDVAAQLKADSLLRASVAEEERFEVPDTRNRGRNLQIEGLHFFKPVGGIILNGFDNAFHPYLDITAPEGSTVYSVLDGSVIYTEWDEASGWTVIIQHDNNIISIYRHNSNLLKKVADNVSAGAAIGILGNNSMAENCHLQFELWQNGTPLDPAIFINF